MGYSQGGGQIYYALARNQDWYADRVVRYVSMSAANYPRQIDDSYERNVSQFLKFDQVGIYNFWGDDASSIDGENCKEISSA